MNDAIQLVLKSSDYVSKRFEKVATKIDEAQSDVREIRKDLRFRRRGIVWLIVVSILFRTLGIMATIHAS